MPLHLRAPLVFTAYARKPPGSPPRRWTGLVGYGRLDILVRLTLAALYTDGHADPLTQLVAVLDSDGSIEAVLLDQSCLSGEAMYEHDIGPAVLEALRGERCERERYGSLAEFVAAVRAAGYRVVLLREWGKRFTGYTPYTLYIIGMRDDPPDGIGEDGVESVGPRSYLASHVAAFIRLARVLPVGWVMRVKSGPRPDVGPMG